MKAAFDSPEARRLRAYLTAHGHEVFEPTDANQVVRFRCHKGMGVIQRRKCGEWVFAGAAYQAYAAWREGRKFRAPFAKRSRIFIDLDEIIRRDGPECFYCGTELEMYQMTREHLLSVNNGGSNHLSNLVISCSDCNTEAGHLPVIEKVKLREKKRWATL